MSAKPAMVDLIRASLTAFGPAPESSIARLAAVARLQDLGPRQLWQRAGDQPTRVGVVVEGLFRMFFTRSDGRELNKSFVRRGDWIGVLDGLILGEPSRLSIEALTASHIISFPYSELEALYNEHMYWSVLGRKIVEKLYIKKVRREASFLLDSAEERYRLFRHEYADIENDLPDYQIAGYLGITPVALSRIKRRINLAD